MRWRQIWDDVASSHKLAHLTDGEERLFWALWASQVVTDDWGNFRWLPEKIYLGCIPGRRRWNADRVAKELEGLRHKKMVIRYKAEGKSYGHFIGFIERTVVGRGHHRKHEFPPYPPENTKADQPHPQTPHSTPAHPSHPSAPTAPDGTLCTDGPRAGVSPSPSPTPSPTPIKKELKKESYQGILPVEFKTFWETYPYRPNNPKKLAFAQWNARLKEGRTAAELIRAAKNYRLYCEREGKEGEFVMMAKSFISSNERYVEFLEGVPAKGGADGRIRKPYKPGEW